MPRVIRKVKDPDPRHRYPGEVMDLTNKRFGRLIAISLSSQNDRGLALWLCRCDCGRTKVVRMDFLRNGSTHSCGCLRKRMESISISRTIPVPVLHRPAAVTHEDRPAVGQLSLGFGGTT